MSTLRLNGKQIAATNLLRFNAWIGGREAAADWPDYIRQGKLNRSEIATECGFALSVVRQNPAVKAALEALETRLLASGVLQGSKTHSKGAIESTDTAAVHAADLRIMSSKASAERRVKAIEEQNAALKAENRDLREQLKRYKFLDEHLANTGRLLHA